MTKFLMCLTMVALTGPAFAEGVKGSMAALNAVRETAGVRVVSHSDKLQQAAEAHANDMRAKGFFSHTGSNGSTVGKRVRKAGYRFCWVAENIAKGQKSLDEVMHSWVTSPGHLKNMVHPRASDYGLARVEGDIWVMTLGSRQGC